MPLIIVISVTAGTYSALHFMKTIPYISSSHIMIHKRLLSRLLYRSRAELKISLACQRTDSQLKYCFIAPT